MRFLPWVLTFLAWALALFVAWHALRAIEQAQSAASHSIDEALSACRATVPAKKIDALSASLAEYGERADALAESLHKLNSKVNMRALRAERGNGRARTPEEELAELERKHGLRR